MDNSKTTQASVEVVPAVPPDRGARPVIPSRPTAAANVRPSLARAALAVAKRRCLTYIRYPGWFLSWLIWPALMPLNYVFAARALGGPDGGGLASFARFAGTTDYLGYLVVGTTFWMWFNIMLWGLGTAFRDEQLRGTMESNWLAPVPKVFMSLGAFLGETAMGLASLLMSVASLMVFWGFRLTGDPLALVLVVLISIPSIYGIGLIFASLVMLAKEINAFIFFVRGLMTLFCGIAYPIAVLPGFMQQISAVLPLTHTISAVRTILAGAPASAAGTEIRYLLLSGGLLLALGFFVFEVVQRRMLATGTLGQY